MFDAFVYATFSINLITLGLFIFSYCWYFPGEPKPPPSGTAEQATLARLLCPVFVELARDRLVVQAEVRFSF